MNTRSKINQNVLMLVAEVRDNCIVNQNLNLTERVYWYFRPYDIL